MKEQTIPAELELSGSQRQAILYIEVLGLIHDLGKMTDGFIKKESENANKQDRDFDYWLFVDPRTCYTIPSRCKTVKNWIKNANTKNCAFHARPDLTDTLISMSFKAWDDTEYSLAELAPFVSRTGNWRKNDQWIRELGKNMQPGTLIGFLHGIGHFEKESGSFTKKQAYTKTLRSTPFGHDIDKLPTEPEKTLTAELRQLPLSSTEIQSVLTSAEQRSTWFERMEKGLSKGLADTRRPINDVTLWDWGYLVASLAKSAAHYIFNYGWPDSLETLPFQTLRINLDRLLLYADNDRIPDLLGKQNAIDEAYRKVRHYIEFDLAIGNRIYHDETGEYYLIPGALPGEDPETALRNAIQGIFTEKSLEDCKPRIHFGSCVQAGQLDKQSQKNASSENSSVIEAIQHLLVNQRREAQQESPVQYDNNLSLFEDEWNSGKPENAERCSVCGLRPVGYPVTGNNPETEQHLEQWAEEQKANERHLCRICLNRRGRRAKDWADEWAGPQQDPVYPKTIWTDEAADDNGRAALFVGCFGLEHWLDGTALQTTRMSEKHGKNPSPARLFRISETARSFWTEVNNMVLPDSQAGKSVRLVLTPVDAEKLDRELGKFHTYEIENHGIRIAVVWDSTRKHFLSIENLNGLLKRHGFKPDMLNLISTVKERFENKECSLYQTSSYGNASFRKATVRIGSAIPSTRHYNPVIPLMAEPDICMNLLPANSAIDVSLNVLEKYQKEMNRVQDRLPMGIGLVFFPRRTPVRTVMEAGRAMLKMLKKKPETWAVAKKRYKSKQVVDITYEDNTNSRIPFSYKSSLSGTEDRWNLWCLDGESTPKEINKLSEGDTVKVYPGQFDFEYLDTSGRRFDIRYNELGRRPRVTRPFYLTDIQRITALWQRITSLGTSSQIHQIIELIETRRTEWRITPETTDEQKEVFRKFVRSTLAGAEWPSAHPWQSLSAQEKEALVQAGFEGVLTDVAELYLSVLKSPLTENMTA